MEVNEILVLLSNGKLLTGTKSPVNLSSKIIVVDHIPDDRLMAGENGKPYDSCVAGELVYKDLREEWYADVIGEDDLGVETVIEEECFQNRELDPLIAVGNQLPEDLYCDADWIHCDIMELLHYRAVFGRRDVANPLELLCQIYLSGGWPVGFSKDSGSENDFDKIMVLYPGLSPINERQPKKITYQEWLIRARENALRGLPFDA